MRYLILFTVTILFSINSQAQTWEQLNDQPFYEIKTMSFSHNGKGYTMSNQRGLKRFWEYEPTTDSWVILPDGDYNHKDDMLGYFYNGKFYFGMGQDNNFPDPGDDQPSPDIWTYDPITADYELITSNPTVARSSAGMVVKDSLLYVVAGAKNFGMGFDKELWVYNLNSNDWEQRADITIEDCHFPMQFSVGDDIYIAGSHGDEDSFMKYNYASNTWTAFNNQLGSRHTGVALEYNGKVYFIGGSEGTHNELLEEQAFVEYDPIMDTYTSLNPAEDYNKEFANAFIIGTELYVFGGVPNFFGSDHTKTMWKTDLSLLNPSTSLDESTYGVKELSISPNPVDDILNISDLDISKEKYSVIIYDALASQVYSGLLNRSDLNLSSLKSGLYTLLVFSDSEHFSTSFIKI